MATDTVTIVTFINTNFTPNAVLPAITEEQLKKKSLNLKIGKTSSYYFFYVYIFSMFKIIVLVSTCAILSFKTKQISRIYFV